MDTKQDFNLIFYDLERLLAEEKAYHEDRAKKIRALEHRLALARFSERPVKGDDDSSRVEQVVIADGQRLSRKLIAALNDDDYDVILNMTNCSLRFRRDPTKRNKLEVSKLIGIGPHRIRILAILLEHPGRPISWENLPNWLGTDDQPNSPEAFVKSISELRKALGVLGRSNPYIIDEPAWTLSSRKRARAYTANLKWKYLVIRWANKKSL